MLLTVFSKGPPCWVWEQAGQESTSYIQGPRCHQRRGSTHSEGAFPPVPEVWPETAIPRATPPNRSRPKPDGTWRPVINLKSLNRYVVAHHFKMETIRTVKGLIKPRDWLLKLDLKDAYLTVPTTKTTGSTFASTGRARHGNFRSYHSV